MDSFSAKKSESRPQSVPKHNLDEMLIESAGLQRDIQIAEQLCEELRQDGIEAAQTAQLARTLSAGIVLVAVLYFSFGCYLLATVYSGISIALSAATSARVKRMAKGAAACESQMAKLQGDLGCLERKLARPDLRRGSACLSHASSATWQCSLKISSWQWRVHSSITPGRRAFL